MSVLYKHNVRLHSQMVYTTTTVTCSKHRSNWSSLIPTYMLTPYLYAQESLQEKLEQLACWCNNIHVLGACTMIRTSVPNACVCAALPTAARAALMRVAECLWCGCHSVYATTQLADACMAKHSPDVHRNGSASRRDRFLLHDLPLHLQSAFDHLRRTDDHGREHTGHASRDAVLPGL